MLLLIDNYDSFTHILALYFKELGQAVVVKRNDHIALADIRDLDPDYIVISPGPGSPDESGICPDVVRSYAGVVPMLGVCLGHQIIGKVFGGVVKRASRAVHGKISVIQHRGRGIFCGMPQRFDATRYHSLSVMAESVPETLAVTAWATESTGVVEVMGLRHTRLAIEGVQFHPESIGTPHGRVLLRNFLANYRWHRYQAGTAHTVRASAVLEN